MQFTKERRKNPIFREEVQENMAVKTALDEIVRTGAQDMLKRALEIEVNEFLEKYRDVKDNNGRQQVVRNGYLPERELITGAGLIRIKQPRVDDRMIRKESGNRVFTSNILPRFLRRIPSIDNLIPALYLKGLSTGSFPEALAAILGDKAKGLSAGTVVRLKEQWEYDYERWAKRDLSEKNYVYFWVDGIYFNVRLTDDRPCILTIIGATEDGTKELVALYDGERESKLSWKEVLLDLKQRGLMISPKLAIGDGALGFWAALEEVYQSTRQQLCWQHKTVNILNKVPKSIQEKVKSSIYEMYMAETKRQALKAFNNFIDLYGDKYPKATECLIKDKERLFTFYDFPAAQWTHLRTTNPIESTFATVRHRTRLTKGCGSRRATLAMAFKLTLEAQKTWHKLKGNNLLIHVINNVPFVDGILINVA